MPQIAITGLQSLGALVSPFGQYSFQTPWRGSIRYGLAAMRPNPVSLSAACPEGSRMVNGACECYEGRVWMPDRSKCVSPQSPAYTGAITWEESMEGHTPGTYGQQELTEAAKRTLEQAGYKITCKIDDSWVAGPQGGTPSRICSINGSPYMFGAYAINLNPRGAIADYNSWSAAEKIQAATGIPSGSLYRTPETAVLLNTTAQTGVVNEAQARAAVESVAKQDARGIPEWGILPNTPTVTFDAQSVGAGVPPPSQAQQTYTGPAYNEPTSPYASPYTGGYAQPPAGWTPPPVDAQGVPTAYATGGAGSAGGGVMGAGSDMPSWLLPVLIGGAALMLLKN